RLELRSLTVIAPIDDLFINATELDEASLQSLDGTYKKTVEIKQIGEVVEEQFMKMVFPGVVPGARYTLTYNTNLDSEGELTTNVIMFQNRLIDTKDMLEPLRLDNPFDEQGDEDLGEAD
ncbi:MAG: hypothetical protein R3240_03975, partial [Gammaproteobacteria bacterium]|nr:hypothetical protein [Gammaproteobacteria bacterium]